MNCLVCNLMQRLHETAELRGLRVRLLAGFQSLLQTRTLDSHQKRTQYVLLDTQYITERRRRPIRTTPGSSSCILEQCLDATTSICKAQQIKEHQSMPLRSSASKACATDKHVERSIIVCRRFNSLGACCAICSKEALQCSNSADQPRRSTFCQHIDMKLADLTFGMHCLHNAMQTSSPAELGRSQKTDQSLSVARFSPTLGPGTNLNACICT